jgi:hypothetical protein
LIILANVAIPTVAEHIIIMLMLLAPVAMIEAAVLARRHSLTCKKSLSLSFFANLWSTFVGLGIGYVLALVGLIPAGIFAEFIPGQAGSLISNIIWNVSFHGGAIPNKFDEVGYYLGTLLVMIPYLIATIYVEYRVITRRNSELNTAKLKKTIRIMNCITYSLLVIPVIIKTITAIKNLNP